MIMKDIAIRVFAVVILLVVFVATQSYAQSDIAIYIGVSGKSFSGGGILMPNSNRHGFAFGIEIGTDGKAVDRTFNNSRGSTRNTVFYITPGAHISLKKRSSVLVLPMIGGRLKEKKCSSGNEISFLGFECYAGTESEERFDLAVGIMAVYSLRPVFIGFKLTDGVKEGVVGFRF